MESVGNALRALLFLGAHESASVAELSRHLEVAPSTAHRLLGTLKDFDFAVQDDARRYRLGPAAQEVAARQPPWDVVAVLRPHLEQLAKVTEETVNLVGLQGAHIVFLDGVEGTRTVRVGIRTGDRLPAYTTAGGKALLAQLPPKDIRSLHPRTLAALTNATITSADQLLTELDAVRTRGYATNRAESVDDVYAVGTAINHPTRGAVAALTVSAPAHRINRRRADALAAHLVEAATALTDAWH
jgi:DNA-binding IclR family transcriptional regulator